MFEELFVFVFSFARFHTVQEEEKEEENLLNDPFKSK